MTGQGRDPLVDAVDRLVRAGVALTTRALAQEPGAELTVQQWRVLVIVAEGSGVRVGDIATRIGASRPSASRLVGRLVALGVVRQDPDPADRRATLVQATPEGRRIALAVLRRRRAIVARALRTVAVPEAAVLEALEAICAALDDLA